MTDIQDPVDLYTACPVFGIKGFSPDALSQLYGLAAASEQTKVPTIPDSKRKVIANVSSTAWDLVCAPRSTKTDVMSPKM
ncbi:Protein of unknown function [Pyronema omphalodes CBS 100304]|uniref:Uncharacterized protein n=1 Tax=Pyronema omphalodes (strain CBS 100304) TaxID=1076935 RepID=U4LRW1_PYROM|nr:Protein of unknown function [Pyronema omphalodes CBS 100304]